VLEHSELDAGGSDEEDEDDEGEAEATDAAAAPASLPSLRDFKVGENNTQKGRNVLLRATEARAASLRSLVETVKASADKASEVWHYIAAVTIVQGLLQVAENWVVALQGGEKE
jgi:hypothetical protein